MRTILVFFALLLFTACAIDQTSSSSSGGSSSGGASDGSAAEAGDSGDSATSIDPQRVAICNAYGAQTATCCQQSPGTCTTISAADWTKHCMIYASSCAGMPTCFRGGDCNTLIYCSGAC